MTSKPHQEQHPNVFDDSKTRWYQHALRRFPGSCLISFITLVVAVIMIRFGLAIYRWFAQ
jgi:hypothetical protein